MFFITKKVILCEGSTDEYFFKFFANFLKEKESISWRFDIDSYEILKINGKENYKKWKDFLSAYSIDVYYIGDFDNLSNFKSDISFNQEIEAVSKRLKDKLGVKDSNDGKALIKTLLEYVEKPQEENLGSLKSLICYLRDRHRDYATIIADLTKDIKKWGEIETVVDQLALEYIYILRHGELEDYIPYGNKGMNDLVSFCSNGSFDVWFKSDENKDKARDLLTIFEKILSTSEAN